MEGKLLEELKNKIHEYENTLSKLVEEKKRVEGEIEAAEVALGHYRAVYEKEGGKLWPVSSKPPHGRVTIREAAKIILRESAGPVRASEIANQIVKRGLAKLSKKHATSIAISIMRRRPDEFDALGDGMYALRVE